MRKGHDLENIHLTELSVVKRGANPGARIVLVKHDQGGVDYPNTIEKRDFTADERKSAAATGAAMPDGSFPIHNEDDLSNAVRLAGNASDPAAARAHIKQRAKALGMPDHIPDTWSKSFDQVAGALTYLIEKELDGEGVPLTDFQTQLSEGEGCDELNNLVSTLVQTIGQIGMDDNSSADDKASAIGVSVGQFLSTLRERFPDAETDLKKSLTENPATAEFFTAGSSGHRSSKGDSMSLDLNDPKVKKAIADAVAAANVDLTKKVETLVAENDALKKGSLSDAHQAFADKLPADKKSKFVAMSAADRESEMKKSADEIAKAAAGDEEVKIGETTIRKSVVGEGAFAVVKALHGTVAGQAAEIAKLHDATAESVLVTKIKNDYPHIPGEPLAKARLMRVIEKADPESKKTFETIMKAANEAMAERMTELGGGNGGGADGSAEAELVAKAKVIEKEEKVPFAKAYEFALDRNPKLYETYTKEQAKKARSA